MTTSYKNNPSTDNDSDEENNSERSDSTAIKIYTSSIKLNQKEIDQLVPFRLPFRWEDNLEFGPLSTFVALDKDSIHFVAQWDGKLNFDSSLSEGDFKEGLWEKDAAELFIVDDKSDAYLELNISPAGAWWCSLFSNYRNPDNSFKKPGDVNVATQKLKGAIRTSLSFPKKALPFECRFIASSILNMSGTVTGKKNRYVSWANIETKEPDFHNTAFFERIGFNRLD